MQELFALSLLNFVISLHLNLTWGSRLKIFFLNLV